MHRDEHSLVVFVQSKVRDKDKSEVKVNGSTAQVGNLNSGQP